MSSTKKCSECGEGCVYSSEAQPCWGEVTAIWCYCKKVTYFNEHTCDGHESGILFYQPKPKQKDWQ